MWFGILLTLFFAFVFARVLVNIEADEIIKNWKAYRCLPHVMIFASFFKNKEDPRSDNDFASDNFQTCASEMAKSALQVSMKPVMDIFYQMSNSAIQSIGVTMNLRTLSANLFHGLNRMFDVFTRRFNLTFHEIHMSFIKQFTAIQKANGIATAAVFQGISLIRSIMNAFNLMITVSISILVILVVMVIFLFFLLAPVIPLILITVSVIAAAGGAVGGMASAFCFGPDTGVLLADGTTIRIDKVKNGMILKGNSEVIGLMKFKTDKGAKFRLVDGVLVSGSHIIYDEQTPKFVSDYELASDYTGKLPEYVYCLNTSTRTIPVKGLSASYTFADWEELEDEDCLGWDSLVREVLNGSSGNAGAIDGETGFSQDNLVQTACGVRKLGELAVGDSVYDGVGMTEVIGLAKLNVEGEDFGSVRHLKCTGSTWIKENSLYIRASESKAWRPNTPVSTLISLFTHSGTVMIENEIVRDFSDIGLDNIHTTYNYTLSRLLQKCSTLPKGLW